MKIKCPHCQAPFRRSEKYKKAVVKFGSFYRTSDRKHVQRFFCRSCKLYFSVATLSDCYRQKKRQINHKVARLMSAEVSLRECHRILKVNRKTVARKLVFMGKLAKVKLEILNKNRLKTATLEFDDLETFEHTKCKPLSVTLAVEKGTRWILGYEVSQMPAKGHLIKKSLKKYGYREDLRSQGRERLFSRIKSYVTVDAVIKSDQNPHYPADVKRHFPKAQHITYKGREACILGQGELKKGGFDPLFSLNHTCATLRARMSRLIRRSWCTTKKPERLNLHLAIVSLHHNLNLRTSTA